MPNHCKNKVSFISLNSRTLQDILYKAPGNSIKSNALEYDPKTNQWGYKPNSTFSKFQFNNFVPIPKELENQNYDPVIYNKEKELWSCKWGAYSVNLKYFNGKELKFVFTTAWTPPVNLFRTMSSMYKNVVIINSFAEECPTQGRYVFLNGEIVSKKHENAAGYKNNLQYFKSHKWYVKNAIDFLKSTSSNTGQLNVVKLKVLLAHIENHV